MSCQGPLTTTQILAVFTEAVAVRQGRVIDTFDDGQRLFTRSVLPRVEEIRRGDGAQGGVALKATGGELRLYPYLFRLVCRNGAIIAETLESRCLADVELRDADEVATAIRESVVACCAEEVFAANVRRVRTACEAQADLALALMPMLSRFSKLGDNHFLSQIMDQFFREGDTSRFGLANAVTAIARDTRDPDLRWELEEFGGGIAVGAVPRRPADGGARAAARPRRAVMAG